MNKKTDVEHTKTLNWLCIQLVKADLKEDFDIQVTEQFDFSCGATLIPEGHALTN